MEAEDMVIQPDGKIVLVGRGVFNWNDWAIARYNTDGSLDTSFGTGGKVATDFLGGQDQAHGVALRPDGKIVVGGYWQMPCPYTNCEQFGFALAQYNTNGSLDGSFGDQGKATSNFISSAGAYTMARAANGKLALAGHVGNDKFAVAVYNSNGSPDTTFGAGGWVSTDFKPYYYDRAYAVAVQADGKIVAGGTVNVDDGSGGGQANFGLARYLPGTATPPTATATVPPSSCPVVFADVPTSNTFYPYVQCLACQGIDTGFACGGPAEPCNSSNHPYYRPNSLITRDDLAHMVAASAGFSEPPGAQRFQDVPPSHPYYAWIQRMANRGLIGGYPCGTQANEPCVAPANLGYYRPYANATRGQIAKIVSNGAGFSEPAVGQMFEDVPSTQTFYEWVQRLASRGVMGGYACGGGGEPCSGANRPYFRWSNNATRGQVTKIVSNTFFPSCDLGDTSK
jgi:uncharacterized delta-60 repeat protein